MSDCRQVRPLIGPYLYHDLDDRERQLVDSHLHVCARCRAELDSSRDLLARLPRTLPPPSPQVKARILRQVENRIAASALRPAPSLPVQPGWRLAFAGVAAALLLGLWIGYRLPRTTPAALTAQTPAAVLSPAVPSAPQPAVQAPAAVGPQQQTSRPTGSPEASETIPSRPSLPTARIVTLVQAPRPLGIDDITLASVSEGR
jgi:anti-sigma factor RsiW